MIGSLVTYWKGNRLFFESSVSQFITKPVTCQLNYSADNLKPKKNKSEVKKLLLTLDGPSPL